MRIALGIDQSLTSTGVCVIAYPSLQVLYTGALCTSKTEHDGYADVIIRANDIANKLENIIDMYKVTDIAIEGLSFGSRGDATRNLAILFGVICTKLNITQPYTVAPTSLKKFATGNGKADKKQMLAAIENEDGTLFSQLDNLTIKAGKYDIADGYWLARHILGN